MKLKIKQVSTIPKKLVLLSISMLMLMAVVFTVPVFAAENNIVRLYLDNNGPAIQIDGVTYDDQYADSLQLPGGGLSAYILDNTDDYEFSLISTSGTYRFYLEDNGPAMEINGTKYDDQYANDLQIPGGGVLAYIENETENGDEFLIHVIELDNKVPVISGETTFVSNVADPKDASYFMQFLSAYDETDGDVSDSLKIIADNYTANKSKLGNHTFTIEASDKSGNKTTAIINVRVVDIDKPVITGNTTTATIGYKETYNIENFRKTLTVTDNYDQMTNADIKIKTDGYTTNKTKLGTYNVVFYAKDASGNEGTFTKPIKVIDNVKPTFSGPSIISTSNNTVLTEADVRAQITAHDDIDGNITNRIELVDDNYTGNGNKVGSYTIKYSVKDNANNIEYYIVTIQRTDKIPPTIWVEDGVSIRTNVDTPITYEIIIDILQATGQITVNASTTFSFPLDEYTGNEQEPGIYAMSVKARSTDGNESIFNMSIVVYDTEDDGGIDVNPGFDIKEFVLENKVYFIISGILLLSIGAYVGYRKFKR